MRRPFFIACTGLLLGTLIYTDATADRVDTRIVEKSLQLGRSATAIQQADALLEVRPDSPELLFVKARALAAIGNVDAAVGLYERLIAEHPGLPEPYNNLGVLYAAQGDTQRAAELLQQALEAHPVYSIVYRNLSQVYADRAITAYRKAMGTDSTKSDVPLELSAIGALTRPATGSQ